MNESVCEPGGSKRSISYSFRLQCAFGAQERNSYWCVSLVEHFIIDFDSPMTYLHRVALEIHHPTETQRHDIDDL
ncbi:hypothetical protein TNCV_2132921 [Trichonephila clavipes]|nr:hypothetical protein TNCV_2132921 [Trichonephila clavipes]